MLHHELDITWTPGVFVSGLVVEVGQVVEVVLFGGDFAPLWLVSWLLVAFDGVQLVPRFLDGPLGRAWSIMCFLSMR